MSDAIKALLRGKQVNHGRFTFRIGDPKNYKIRLKDEPFLCIHSIVQSPAVLTTLPFHAGELPSNVKGVAIEGPGIQAIEVSAFAEMKGIEALYVGIPDPAEHLLSGGEIDIGKMSISALPQNIRSLTMFRTQVTIGFEMGSLQLLTKLTLYECDWSELPSYICDLTQLTELDIYDRCTLNCLPDQMCSKLKRLQTLKLTETCLKTLPSNFGDLINLRELDLSRNRQLDGFPNQMFARLKYLQILVLIGVPFLMKELSLHFRDMTELTELYLSNSDNNLNVSVLEELCCKFEKLQKFAVSSCDLKELPFNFCNLIYLKELNLGFNSQLKSLPHQFCAKLIMLELLYLCGCGLKELPSNFGNLTNLKFLELSYNSLSRLPLSFRNLNSFIHLDLSGNPLVDPPEGVWRQGFRAIQTYLSFSRKRNQLKRFKIIVLGEACSGKTSLVQTMRKKKSFCTKEKDRTLGIEETKLNLSDNKKANVLDCGGQKCYMLTNQLFVSEKSLVLLVVDINEYELTKKSFRKHIGQYLEVIYARSQQNQVLVVFTKIDLILGSMEGVLRQSLPSCLSSIQKHVCSQLEDFQKYREIELDRIKDRIGSERFVFSKGQIIRVHDKVFFTSAKRVQLVLKVKRFIDKLESGSLPTVDDFVPEQWVDFESKVVEKCLDMPLSLMEMRDVIELASDYNLTEEQAKIVLKYYHQVGSLLYFSETSCLSHVVFGSSKLIIDVLKKVFCHDHCGHEFKKYYTAFGYAIALQFNKDRNRLVEYGTLSMSLLKALMSNSKLDMSCDLDIIVKLLLAFGFAYIKSDQSTDLVNIAQFAAKSDTDTVKMLEEAKACLLLPWLLKEECPRDVRERFPVKCPELWIEVRICFSFGFGLPLGVFEQFSTRCHPHSPFISHWNSGFLLRYGPVIAQFTHELNGDVCRIVCQGRSPNSNKALLRLFHVLWRCVVELVLLLKEVPGCLFGIYLDSFIDGKKCASAIPVDICSGEVSHSQEEPGIRDMNWRLIPSERTANDRGILACCEAVDLVSESYRVRETLKDVFSSVLGEVVQSSDISSVARRVASEIIDLGDKGEVCFCHFVKCLCIDFNYKDDDPVTFNLIWNMLDYWQKKRGGDACIAVLIDSLEDCGLENVARKCFKNINDVLEDRQIHHQLEMTSQLRSFPRDDIPVIRCVNLQYAVSLVGNEEWRTISSGLGFQSYHLSDVPTSLERKSEKLGYMIDRWCRKEGIRATVGILLKACQTANVSLRKIQEDFSRRENLN